MEFKTFDDKSGINLDVYDVIKVPEMLAPVERIVDLQVTLCFYLEDWMVGEHLFGTSFKMQVIENFRSKQKAMQNFYMMSVTPAL